MPKLTDTSISEKLLLQFRDDVEHVLPYLMETVEAFNLLYEALEEGWQPPESSESKPFDEYAALNFVHRFPMHYATYNVILGNLDRLVKDLQAAVDDSCYSTANRTA